MPAQRRRQTPDARRAQIVRATIEAIADLGYSHTTFAAIAKQGGLSSTRLISYHFVDRAELMRQVGVAVVSEMGAAVATRMERAITPRDALHAYLRANVEYVQTHRAEVIALVSLLFAGALDVHGDAAPDATEQALTEIIAAGVRTGQFGPIDPLVAAAVMQRAVEGILLSVYRSRDVDLSTLGDALVDFFEAGLAPRPSASGTALGG